MHYVRAIFAQTFIVKAIDLCNLSALVVSANECNAVGIANLGSPGKDSKIGQRQERERTRTFSARRSRKVSTE